MQLNNKMMVVAAACALCYSYIPSTAGKIKHKVNRKQIDRNQSEKIIYLTFDDGPSEHTEALLNLLKANDIKATFFVVADFAKARPEVIKKMQDEGHTIGLHSLSHKSAMVQTPQYTNYEFKESLSVMKKLNVNVEYYRPPWGHVNMWTLGNLKKYNLKKVMWDVMAKDWANISSDVISYKLLSRIKAGDIICLHDGRGENNAPKRTIKALETVLPILKEEGFQFRLISDMENVK